MQPIKSLQNTRWFIWAIVAIVVVLGGLAIYIYYQNINEDNNSMFNFFKKKTEITETRDFSCPGMEGFTFKYPVFKGWEVLGVVEDKEKTACTISLSSEELKKRNIHAEYPPEISISIKYITNRKLQIPPPEFKTKNSNNLLYFRDSDSVEFWANEEIGQRIKIDLSTLPSEFPRGQFFQTVIESFK